MCNCLLRFPSGIRVIIFIKRIDGEVETEIKKEREREELTVEVDQGKHKQEMLGTIIAIATVITTSTTKAMNIDGLSITILEICGVSSQKSS